MTLLPKEKKEVKKLIKKKEKAEKELKKLDEKIKAICRSTRTLFPVFIPLHDKLRLKFSWYQTWHLFKFYKIFHFLILFLFLLGISASIYSSLVYPEKIKAATGYVDPDGDDAVAWTPTPSGTHYTTVDDGTRQPDTPTTTDYIASNTANQNDDFVMTSIAGVTSISQITVWANGQSPCPGTYATVNIFVEEAWQTAQNLECFTSGPNWRSVTFTGTWDQTDLDALKVRVTRTSLDTPAITVTIHAVYAVVTYTPPSDTTPPIISSVSTANVTQLEATITWQTDESSTSQVAYGASSGNYPNQTNLDSNLVTSHSVTLSNLSSGTTYYFKVKSKDGSNNEATSSEYSFTTKSQTQETTTTTTTTPTTTTTSTTGASVATASTSTQAQEQAKQSAPGSVVKSEKGSFEANFPQTIKAGTNFEDIRVVVKDSKGKTKTSYQGSIVFESSDPKAGLTFHKDNPYQFQKKEKGSHSFSGSDFILKTKGNQTITIRDKDDENFFTVYTIGVTQGDPAIIEKVSESPYTVRVKDGFGNPIENAKVLITVTNPDGTKKEFKIKTNQKGLASFSLSFDKKGDYEIKASISPENYVLFKSTFYGPPFSPQKILQGSTLFVFILTLLPYFFSSLANLPLLNPFTHPFFWLWHLLNLPFGFFRKKRKPWGVVYDSQSKKPILGVIVRLFDKEYNRLLETQITDLKGRFSFLTREGEYYLQVFKKNYTFPSKIDSSGYRGETIKVKEEPISLNIPLDPKEQILAKRINLLQKLSFYAEKIRIPLLVLGSLFAILVYLLSYDLTDLLVLFLYLCLWILEIEKWRKVKSYGLVFEEETEKPIDFAILRVFEKEKLLQTKVTNEEGKFLFLINPEKYKLLAIKETFKPYNTEIEAKRGIIVSKIGLVKEA